MCGDLAQLCLHSPVHIFNFTLNFLFNVLNFTHWSFQGHTGFIYSHNLLLTDWRQIRIWLVMCILQQRSSNWRGSNRYVCTGIYMVVSHLYTTVQSPNLLNPVCRSVETTYYQKWTPRVPFHTATLLVEWLMGGFWARLMHLYRTIFRRSQNRMTSLNFLGWRYIYWIKHT